MRLLVDLVTGLVGGWILIGAVGGVTVMLSSNRLAVFDGRGKLGGGKCIVSASSDRKESILCCEVEVAGRVTCCGVVIEPLMDHLLCCRVDPSDRSSDVCEDLTVVVCEVEAEVA